MKSITGTRSEEIKKRRKKKGKIALLPHYIFFVSTYTLYTLILIIY